MIIQKARIQESVVLMGETGCGKTYLVKYIAEVLFKYNSEFHQFTFHYGIKQSRFIDFIENIITRAFQSPNLIFWVFLDEFNTSELQPYVCELLVDRVFSLKTSCIGIFFYLFIN